MNIGNKIRRLRISSGLTQAQLAGNKITRNMLSAIESGKATPSLETLFYLSERLEVPASFLVSDSEDLFFYEKSEIIDKAKHYFHEQKYSKCIELITKCSTQDDELSYILCLSYFNLGKTAVLNGALNTGKRMLESSFKFSQKTIYNTSITEAIGSIYYSLAENIQSPLLEFDINKVENTFSDETELDLFNYIIQNYEYKYKTKLFSRHLTAKEMIKNRHYYDALSELLLIEEEKSSIPYNAYFIFSIYSDIEVCYRQLGDFENAYRYASKRLSLIDAFKS